MFPRCVIGIDPGPVAGVVCLSLVGLNGADAAQVTEGGLLPLLHGWHALRRIEAIAVERFVVSPRAGRSSTPAGGAAARAMVAQVCDWAAQHDLLVVLRSAADVKPWATDERLRAAGLYAMTEGMRHARDGARHALYEAVNSHGRPDPLSRKAGAR